MSGKPTQILQRFFLVGIRHPLPTLLLLLAISVATALGLPRLSIDTGVDTGAQGRFDQRARHIDPRRQATLRVAREFGSDQRSFIYLQDPNLWSVARLQALERLHADLRQLPFVERIDDLFTLRKVRSVDGHLHAMPLLSSVPTDAVGVERARRDTLDDPIAVRNLIAADGNSIAIGIVLREAADGDGERDMYGALERTIAPLRGQFATVEQLGAARIDAEIRAGLLRDLGLLTPAAALVAMLIAYAVARRIAATLLPPIVAAIALLWTFGLMGWVGIPLSLLAAALPTLALGVATVAVLRTFGTAAAASGSDEDSSPPGPEPSLSPPLITVVVAACGFASLAIVEIPMIRDFGLVAAFAILATGLVAMLVVPRVAAAHPAPRLSPSLARASRRLTDLSARAFGLMRRRGSLWALAVLIVIGSASVVQSPPLRVGNEAIGFLRAEHPATRMSQRMREEIAGPRLFYVMVEAEGEGAFQDPANVRRLVDIQTFLARQQIFDRSLSLADVLAQAEAAGDRREAPRIPATRKRVAEALMLYSPRDLEPWVSHDFRRANIVVRHHVPDSSTLNRHLRELREVVVHLAGPDMRVEIVGEDLSINAAAERLPEQQGLAFGALLALLAIVMTLMFTSVRGGIIALVPGAIPFLMVVGLMRLLELPLGPATALLAALAVAIAADGTIRLFSRYSECCAAASSYDAAVETTLRHESAAILGTALSVALSASVLLLSGFAPIARFGALVAATVACSLFATLLLTPLVMSRIRLVGLYEILAMSMQREALERSPLFRGMNGYQIRKTILICELRTHQDGDRLITQGTTGRSMFIVVSGQLDVLRRDESDGERRLATLGPGDVFGEIGFVRDTQRTADVRARGEVAVLCLDHRRLERDLAFFPHIMAKLNFNISGILGQRLAELVEAGLPAGDERAESRGADH